jgi:tetratricopeptide (TPR) repeat protein
VTATDPVAGTAARRARRAAERRGAEEDATQRRGADRSPEPPEARARRRDLDPDELAALEEERDFLLRSLRDLDTEHAAGDVDEHDYTALKDDYTARAATVLRAIEQRQAAMAAARPPRRPFRRALVVGVVGLLAVGLGVAVAQASGRRGAGDQITGDIRQSSRDKLLEARGAMGEGRYREAIGLFDEVLGQSPSNVEAHTYKGWLLTLTAKQLPAGRDQELLRGRALQSLDKAVELDPAYPDARIFRAMLRDDLGQPAAGLADLDSLQPGAVPAGMQPMVDSLRNRLRGAAAAPPAPG